MKTYRVSGPFPFRGHAPGSTFEADPKDTVVVRAVTRGSITATDGVATTTTPEPVAPVAEDSTDTQEKAPAPPPKTHPAGQQAGDKEKK
jgi:hypothetical protein